MIRKRRKMGRQTICTFNETSRAEARCDYQLSSLGNSLKTGENTKGKK